jgi:hypothetical protein
MRGKGKLKWIDDLCSTLPASSKMLKEAVPEESWRMAKNFEDTRERDASASTNNSKALCLAVKGAGIC